MCCLSFYPNILALQLLFYRRPKPKFYIPSWHTLHLLARQYFTSLQ